MLQISQLYVYPVKSLAGIALKQARVTDRGLEHDRRWMLIDENNRFISQRELPQMALLKPSITTQGILVNRQGQLSSYIIPFKPQTNQYIEVSVWDDTCTGQLVDAGADAWFSNALNFQCRLVYMPEETHRQVDPRYASEEHVTSFSDAYPFLIIGEESMIDLSKRVGREITINRFRPNIVFSGGEAYVEDALAHFSIGDMHFYGVKICARCPIPNIDPDTAISGKEPIKTLARYRRKNNKIYLGQNLIHTGLGQLHVGDVMEVLEMKNVPEFDV